MMRTRSFPSRPRCSALSLNFVDERVGVFQPTGGIALIPRGSVHFRIGCPGVGDGQAGHEHQDDGATHVSILHGLDQALSGVIVPDSPCVSPLPAVDGRSAATSKGRGHPEAPGLRDSEHTGSGVGRLRGWRRDRFIVPGRLTLAGTLAWSARLIASARRQVHEAMMAGLTHHAWTWREWFALPAAEPYEDTTAAERSTKCRTLIAREGRGG